MEICYICNCETQSHRMSFHADAKKHVIVCDTCFIEYQKDPRHMKAYKNIFTESWCNVI